MAPSGFYFGSSSQTVRRLEALAAGTGLRVAPAAGVPEARALRAPRVGLWDQYGGSMTSGWTRWILEQFEFAFERVFPPELDAGGLHAKYDVLVFPSGGIPSERDGSGGRGPSPEDVPEEYRGQIGRVSAQRTIPRLREFAEAGGTIVAIGSSAGNLARLLRLDVEDHLTENGAALPRSKYFVPGSILSAKVETTHPVAAGMSERVDVFFDNSPVFRLKPGAEAAGVRPIAWFDGPTPLRSGWAWGQHYLNGGVVAIDVPIGRGRVLLFGPEILHRAQPHGTFKFLFNSLYAENRGQVP
jgi:hypothetical protein